MTSCLYVPTPLKSIMVLQIMPTPVFNFSFLKLHLICSRIQKSRSDSSLVFSQSDITVVPLAYVILAPIELYLLVPSAKLTDTNLMGRHHKQISIISSCSMIAFYGFKLIICQKKCNTGQSTNMTPPRSQTFSMVPITVHSWRLLSLLVMKNFPCGSSLIPEM
jgi:hypothetical protein